MSALCFDATRRVEESGDMSPSPKRWRDNWFMVPMHAKNRKEALHEPEHPTSNEGKEPSPHPDPLPSHQNGSGEGTAGGRNE